MSTPWGLVWWIRDIITRTLRTSMIIKGNLRLCRDWGKSTSFRMILLFKLTLATINKTIPWSAREAIHPWDSHCQFKVRHNISINWSLPTTKVAHLKITWRDSNRWRPGCTKWRIVVHPKEALIVPVRLLLENLKLMELMQAALTLHSVQWITVLAKSGRLGRTKYRAQEQVLMAPPKWVSPSNQTL